MGVEAAQMCGRRRNEQTHLQETAELCEQKPDLWNRIPWRSVQLEAGPLQICTHSPEAEVFACGCWGQEENNAFSGWQGDRISEQFIAFYAAGCIRKAGAVIPRKHQLGIHMHFPSLSAPFPEHSFKWAHARQAKVASEWLSRTRTPQLQSERRLKTHYVSGLGLWMAGIDLHTTDFRNCPQNGIPFSVLTNASTCYE